MTTQPILALLPLELAQICAQMGEPSYRARQIFSWLHRRHVVNFDAMTNIPSTAQQRLQQQYHITLWSVRDTHDAADRSIKWLLRAQDGAEVETVLMPHRGRRTQCISTQVGCKFGCRFCASGLFGFTRHLGADEMVAQVLHACRAQPKKRPTHVVIMGMGEPFDNYQPLVRALRILNHPDGLRLGKRRLTISTVGLPKKILAFAEEGLPVELSVSLHSAIPEVRSQLMPVNRAFPIKDVLAACWVYMQKTKRLVTFEYILIDGLNADRQNAAALTRALHGHPAKVNLIPYNPIAEFPAARPSLRTIRAFQHRLQHAGIPTTVRFSKGADIAAACGQLRLHPGDNQRA